MLEIIFNGFQSMFTAEAIKAQPVSLPVSRPVSRPGGAQMSSEWLHLLSVFICWFHLHFSSNSRSTPLRRVEGRDDISKFHLLKHDRLPPKEDLHLTSSIITHTIMLISEVSYDACMFGTNFARHG